MSILLVILSIVGGIFALCLPALRGYNLKHIGGRVYAFEKQVSYKDSLEGLYLRFCVMQCYITRTNPFEEKGLDDLMALYNMKNGYGIGAKSKEEIKEMLKKCNIYDNTSMLSIPEAKEMQSKILNQMTNMIYKR